MQIHPGLLRQPKRSLSPDEAKKVRAQLDEDWDRFEGLDQFKVDRDHRGGKVDAYHPGHEKMPPSRYEAESRHNQLWARESLFANNDPNSIPAYSYEFVADQQGKNLNRYEEERSPQGTTYRLYLVDDKEAWVRQIEDKSHGILA